ncbi:MAG: hypothetical protein J5762_04870 [Clostridia bacterium]|nr:hypothetical protein [Clostridia bacterium]
MKKLLSLLLVLSLFAACAACKPGKNDGGKDSAETETSASVPETSVNVPEAAMSYAEYVAAELDSQVVVETYVQAKQSWWDNKATFYTQNEDGAIFIYNMPCTEEDYAKLTPGTKIKVKGYKSAWAGEVEIIDAVYDILEGHFIAQPLDVTALLGTDELEAHQNQFVSFKGLTVVASTYTDNDVQKTAPFLYNWNGSGSHDANSDLYFNVSDGENTYTFTVESYLCDKNSEVYAAVEALDIGDVIDMEGFLYWYNGVNPHITKVTPATIE